MAVFTLIARGVHSTDTLTPVGTRLYLPSLRGEFTARRIVQKSPQGCIYPHCEGSSQLSPLTAKPTWSCIYPHCEGSSQLTSRNLIRLRHLTQKDLKDFSSFVYKIHHDFSKIKRKSSTATEVQAADEYSRPRHGQCFGTSRPGSKKTTDLLPPTTACELCQSLRRDVRDPRTNAMPPTSARRKNRRRSALFAVCGSALPLRCRRSADQTTLSATSFIIFHFGMEKFLASPINNIRLYDCTDNLIAANSDVVPSAAENDEA